MLQKQFENVIDETVSNLKIQDQLLENNLQVTQLFDEINISVDDLKLFQEIP